MGDAWVCSWAKDTERRIDLDGNGWLRRNEIRFPACTDQQPALSEINKLQEVEFSGPNVPRQKKEEELYTTTKWNETKVNMFWEKISSERVPG